MEISNNLYLVGMWADADEDGRCALLKWLGEVEAETEGQAEAMFLPDGDGTLGAMLLRGTIDGVEYDFT